MGVRMFGAPHRAVGAAGIGGLVAAEAWAWLADGLWAAPLGDPAVGPGAAAVAGLVGLVAVGAAARSGAAAAGDARRARWLGRWTGLLAGGFGAVFGLAPAWTAWAVAEASRRVAAVPPGPDALHGAGTEALAWLLGAPLAVFALGAGLGWGLGGAVAGAGGRASAGPSPMAGRISAAYTAMVNGLLAVAALVAFGSLGSTIAQGAWSDPSWWAASVVVIAAASVAIPGAVAIGAAGALWRLRGAGTVRRGDALWGIVHGLVLSLPVSVLPILQGVAAALGLVPWLEPLTAGEPIDLTRLESADVAAVLAQAAHGTLRGAAGFVGVALAVEAVVLLRDRLRGAPRGLLASPEPGPAEVEEEAEPVRRRPGGG